MALRSAGGGGWGNPLDRDATRVLTDVIRGYVSLEKAASDYGVVIDLAKKQIDEAATRASEGKNAQGAGMCMRSMSINAGRILLHIFLSTRLWL